MAKKGAIIEADRLVTHNHWHAHPGQQFRDDGKRRDHHGHWHPHDAREKERHEHQHSALDIWPHKGCAVEVLPPKAEPAVEAVGPRTRKRKGEP